MKITLKTLTPLWTGGIDGKVDRLHETGIIGSLRWWYEALVRGLGGVACDPSQGTCQFDAEKYAKSRASDERQRLRDAGLCDVCQVFGATGWRRRFRITIDDDDMTVANIRHPIKANRLYKDRRGKQRTPTWYFQDPTSRSRPTPPNTPRQGTVSISILSLDQKISAEVIGGLIQFIAKWAALGARPQMGFGVVERLDEPIDMQPFYDWVITSAGPNTYPDLPSLQNIFLARIAPKDDKQFSEQDTFNLKYDLRRLFAKDKDLRHFIMGTVKDSRIAAKVKMSRPYNGGREIRVWGWIPKQAGAYHDSWNRDVVVAAIYQHLSTNYTLQVWREINSPRDSAKPDNSNAQAFLQSLLVQKEEEDAA